MQSLFLDRIEWEAQLSNNNFMVRRAAVLGAGVMGAQIAAHLVNANVETLLFELPAKQGDPNANVTKAVENLKKLEPAPLSVAAKAIYIQAANYDQHLELLKDCDLVIEAIAERRWLRRFHHFPCSAPGWRRAPRKAAGCPGPSGRLATRRSADAR